MKAKEGRKKGRCRTEKKKGEGRKKDEGREEGRKEGRKAKEGRKVEELSEPRRLRCRRFIPCVPNLK